METSASLVINTLWDSYLKSCLKPFPVKRTSNRVLRLLWTKCRQLINKANKDGDEEDWKCYRISFIAFKDSTCRKKGEHCKDLEGTTKTAMLMKVLSKYPSMLEFLSRTGRIFSASSWHTIQILLDSHFLDCKDEVTCWSMTAIRTGGIR